MVGDCHEVDAGRHGVKLKEVLTPLRKYCPFLCDDVMSIQGRAQKFEKGGGRGRNFRRPTEDQKKKKRFSRPVCTVLTSSTTM